MGAAVRYWVRGSNYSDQDLRDADAVVVILPGNSFNYEVCNLTAGAKSEIKLANVLKKPIYIAYTSVTVEQLGIYESVLGFGRISGIAGTTHKLSSIVQEHNRASNKEAMRPFTHDVCEKAVVVAPLNPLQALYFLHHRAMLVEQRINLVKPDKRLLIMML